MVYIMRPSNPPLEKPVCRSGSSSYNWTWTNRLIPNRKRSRSRLYVVTLLTYMQSTSWGTLGWRKYKLEWRLPEETSITSDCRWHYPLTESEEELKSLLIKEKEESEKIGLKLNILKAKIMASNANTSWQVDGETVETVADIIFFGGKEGSKIIADGDCSHEIIRHLLLGRKVMTNLDSILKCRDSTLSTKVRLVKTMVFPVVMYGCESWTIKKAEHPRINDFNLWCWRRLLRVLGLQGDPTSPF